MKYFIAVAVTLIVSLNLTGCTSIWELKYGKEKPAITHQFLTIENNPRHGIYAWGPDASAAVTLGVYKKDSDGKIIPFERSKLVLDSETVASSNKSKDKNYGIERKYRTENETAYLYEQKTCVMSAAAIKTRDSEGGLTVKIPASTVVELGAVARELQKATVLSSKNEAATFLDVALFGICMASLNGYIEDPEIIKSLIMSAIENSATIATKVEETKQEALNPDPKQNPSGIKVDEITSGGESKQAANPAIDPKGN